jgi:hypothetical protein
MARDELMLVMRMASLRAEVSTLVRGSKLQVEWSRRVIAAQRTLLDEVEEIRRRSQKLLDRTDQGRPARRWRDLRAPEINHPEQVS